MEPDKKGVKIIKSWKYFKNRLEKKDNWYYIMEHEEIRAADTDNLEAVVAEWQTRLVQVQVLSPEWGFNSPRRHQNIL